ncbi:MAG: DMT family transporter [Epsilonproteobacteria bacterium]|uniref:EamA/RhaT family transporter n=2 Tax=Sulfurospirillaceae TaxID=2932623 RepID=A0A2D3WJJ2_9BACT|nr:DMT family transporter [Sulfurospirillum cavolei]MCP3653147.1 DMT family transporter [Sulfurospirillum sp. DNRA8]NCB53461.1 DMT family transporter [Campylobacterota bacterium]DAB37269.1 MAG TPA: EamA/RhaT family transporter [Sulfurospirillum cavolei]
MLVSSFSFAIDGAFAKVLSQDFDSVEVVFFRNGLTMCLMAATFLRKPLKQVGGKPWLLLFRALIGFFSMLVFFYNIAHIPLADAMTFSRTAPIFTAILAFFFLKEHIGWKGWVAVFFGFVGIVMVMKPGELMLSKTDFFGIMSGLGAALAYTSVRELNKVYDTRIIVLAFVSTGTVFPALFMLLSEFYHTPMFDFMLGNFKMPSGVQWLYIGLMGFSGAVGQLYMTKAFGTTKAGIVGAAGYSIIFFSLLIGLFLGDPLPDFMGLFGILLVILSGVIVAKEKE